MSSTNKIPNEIEELVNKLVLDFSSTSSKITQKNIQRCVEFVLFHVCCEKYSNPDRNQTEELLETFATRYDYLGFPGYAEELNKCVTEFSPPALKDGKVKENLKWRILEFLVKLSSEAFKTENIYSLETKLKQSKKAVYPEEITEEECINWFQYLREGSERFQLPSDDDSGEETLIQNSTSETETLTKNIVPLYNDVFQKLDNRESLVLDENATILSVFADSIQSKNWLLKHKQNSWWSERHCSTSTSKYPSANFGINWERAQNTLVYSSPLTNFTTFEYYTEYKLIREIFWLLCANDKQYITRRTEFIRSKVSVSSLIQETFSSFIYDLLEVAEKYCSVLSFHQQIFNENVLLTPFTFQAYSCTLKMICQPFIDKVLDLEKIVQRQEENKTLLCIREELGPYLEQFRFIHDVHNSAVHSNWSTEPAWLVTVRLLSIVNLKLQELLRRSQVEIMLKIFFKTFKVYADIIDHWLTEGKLNDSKNEFFIKRLDDGTCIIFPHATTSTKTFTSSFFLKIGERLENCSKNVDFLCKLNKMPELRSQLLKEGKLIDVFIKEFLKRVFKENSITAETNITKYKESEIFSNPSTYRFQSINEFNHYLVRAFKNQLNVNEEVQIIESKSETFRDLDNLPDLELFNVSKIVEDSLYHVLGVRERIIADLFKFSLINEYHLFQHIDNLSNLLLMDLHGFCNKINIRLDNKFWEGNHLIKVFLYDCIEYNKLMFGDLCQFKMDTEDDYADDVCVSEIIKGIDCIHLKYTVQWPMNMIFNDNIVINFYEKLLKLVLKVNTAFSSVTRLHYKDLPQIKIMKFKLRRMQMFRYWVVQLLCRLRSYLALTISQCLEWKVIEKVIEINSFSSLQTHYSTYLENVKQPCLICPEMCTYLESALVRIWHVCDDVRELWSKSIKLQLTEQDITKSVELYLQCIWYLTEVLGKFVKGKQKNNPLYDLWFDISYMMEVHKKNIPEDLTFQSTSITFSEIP